jgi:hypothetical protein
MPKVGVKLLFHLAQDGFEDSTRVNVNVQFSAAFN